jgi:excisionase family DNA binding protein
MTTREVANEIGMSVRFVEARIKDGSLEAYAWDTGLRRVYRVRRSHLDHFRATHLRPATELLESADGADEEA